MVVFFYRIVIVSTLFRFITRNGTDRVYEEVPCFNGNFSFPCVFFSFRYSILDFRLTLDDDDYCDSSLWKIKFFDPINLFSKTYSLVI